MRTGMQQYLCFLMPFSCGTDPLFFWLLLSNTSASLKLASDTPSYDSSESRPVGERVLLKVTAAALRRIPALSTRAIKGNTEMHIQRETKLSKGLLATLVKVTDDTKHLQTVLHQGL